MVIEVLKWAGIVLAAGFVGYFGRHLAMQIIEKISKNKKEESDNSKEDKDYKIEKKKLKLEKKKLKLNKKKG